jgi:hypothetical protein
VIRILLALVSAPFFLVGFLVSAPVLLFFRVLGISPTDPRLVQGMADSYVRHERAKLEGAVGIYRCVPQVLSDLKTRPDFVEAGVTDLSVTRLKYIIEDDELLPCDLLYAAYPRLNAKMRGLIQDEVNRRIERCANGLGTF